MDCTASTNNNRPAVSSRHVLALVGVVVLIALPIRLYLAVDAPMVSRDGVAFIWYAQNLADNPSAEIKIQAQHPLYPALILVTHKVLEVIDIVVPIVPDDPVLSWQLAGMTVTLVGGLVVVLAVYTLTRILFDRRIALIAAVLAALTAEFCQLSADVLTDMPFLALFLFAISAAVYGMDKRSYKWLASAGLLSGLAFLTRPEGAEVAMATVFVIAVLSKSWNLRQKLICVLVVALAALVVASPYMLATGKLVQKKPVEQFFKDSEAPAATDRHLPLLTDTSGFMAVGQNGCDCFAVSLVRALGRILENWIRALRLTLLLPVIVWLLRYRRLPVCSRGGLLVAAIMILHLLVLLALIARFDYLDKFSLRHVMILAGASLPFSAAGVTAILDMAATHQRRWLAVALTALLVGPTLPWMFEVRHAHNLYLRRAGEWIRANSDHKPRIMTSLNRVVYYADGEILRLQHDSTVADIIARSRTEKPDWLVFAERRILKVSESFCSDLQRELSTGELLTEHHAEPGTDQRGGDRIIIYRYSAPP